MNFLAQAQPTTQPVELTMSKVHAALIGGLAGGLLAFYHDLNAYLTAKEAATWDWKKTGARVSAGVLGGVLLAMGMTLPV